MRTGRAHLGIFLSTALLLAAGSTPGAAQDVEMLGLIRGRRPPPSYYAAKRANPRAFEFSGEGGWVRRAQEAAARRRPALRGGVPLRASAAAGPTISGDLNMPALLVVFANTDSVATAVNLPRDTMDFRLFGAHDPSSCTPTPCYSVHSYYDEISAGNLSVNGTVVDWVRVGSDDTFYEGGPGCNGLGPCGRVSLLISDAVFAADPQMDWGLFDNDGPDNIPNTSDDDGFVDALVILHPELDGSCGLVRPEAADNIWAHRFRVSGISTSDSSGSGKRATVGIRDYIIQGGQGGDAGCTPDQPQSMGIVAHETGHVWLLPDLYDTFLRTAGIGDWGLMGTGNFSEPFSPAHMMAWSRAELGWITEVVIADDTTFEISPVAVSDTAYILPIPGTNEYFQLENRQRIGSDAHLWGPGLLIWHIDSALISSRFVPFVINAVNAIDPHGIALEQADGRDDLSLSSSSRGDDQDPFPGGTGNSRFGPNSNPSSNTNAGDPTGVLVDSITQVTPGGAVRVSIVFSHRTVITASDTLARFEFDSVPTNNVREFLNTGDTHTLSIDSVQMTGDNLRRFTWVSWSNAQPRVHQFTSDAKGDTIVANLDAEYWLQATSSSGGGTVSVVEAVDPAGEFLSAGSTVTLVAELTDSSFVFEGWTGTTTSSSDTLALTMNKPEVLTAVFAAPLVVAPPSPPMAVMGATYTHQLVAAGGIGSFTWTRVSGTIPPGLTLVPTGLVTGIPTDSGSYTFDALVVSGLQRDTVSVNLTVTTPTLALTNVVNDILGITSVLTPSDKTFLDLIGNQNGGFDVGDFLAWVEATGQMQAAASLPQARALIGRKP